MGIYGGLMGSNGIYPLVNIQKTMERSTMLLSGKLTISMAMASSSQTVSHYQRVSPSCPMILYFLDYISIASPLYHVIPLRYGNVAIKNPSVIDDFPFQWHLVRGFPS